MNMTYTPLTIKDPFDWVVLAIILLVVLVMVLGIVF